MCKGAGVGKCSGKHKGKGKGMGKGEGEGKGQVKCTGILAIWDKFGGCGHEAW